MKKLQLDTLTVDSFATAEATAKLRGTVAARQTGQCTYRDCPDSWDGTCWMSCWDSCTCDTDFC
jgi:hypothetical protein